MTILLAVYLITLEKFVVDLAASNYKHNYMFECPQINLYSIHATRGVLG